MHFDREDDKINLLWRLKSDKELCIVYYPTIWLKMQMTQLNVSNTAMPQFQT
jgi:hypothetical protein